MTDRTFASTLRKVFWGPDSIRAGWRFLIYLPLTYVFFEATSALLNHIPLTARILSAHGDADDASVAPTNPRCGLGTCWHCEVRRAHHWSRDPGPLTFGPTQRTGKTLLRF
jgi:hypothetical protein